MRVDAMCLGAETMILFVSELPQNPIFITILSDYPHLKNNKKVFSSTSAPCANILFDLFSFA